MAQQSQYLPELPCRARGVRDPSWYDQGGLDKVGVERGCSCTSASTVRYFRTRVIPVPRARFGFGTGASTICAFRSFISNHPSGSIAPGHCRARRNYRGSWCGLPSALGAATLPYPRASNHRRRM